MVEIIGDNKDTNPNTCFSVIDTSESKHRDLKMNVILIATRYGHLTESTMNYALAVAKRLSLRLLVAYINTMPFLWDSGVRGRLFAEAVQESIEILEMKAQSEGVFVDSVNESGKVSKVISRLCRIVKNIEFIIIDTGINIDEVVLKSPVPVFNLFNQKLTRQEIISEIPISKNFLKNSW